MHSGAISLRLCLHRKPFECHIRLSMGRRYANLYNNIHGQIKFIGKTLLVKKKKKPSTRRRMETESDSIHLQKSARGK